MIATRIFYIASACLCIVLAAFANQLFDWGNRLTRRLGFNKLADFRERWRKPLLPIAQIALVITAIIIIITTIKLGR